MLGPGLVFWVPILEAPVATKAQNLIPISCKEKKSFFLTFFKSIKLAKVNVETKSWQVWMQLLSTSPQPHLDNQVSLRLGSSGMCYKAQIPIWTYYFVGTDYLTSVFTQRVIIARMKPDVIIIKKDLSNKQFFQLFKLSLYLGRRLGNVSSCISRLCLLFGASKYVTYLEQTCQQLRGVSIEGFYFTALTPCKMKRNNQ